MPTTPPSTESVAKALIINDQQAALILTIGEHTEQPAKSFTPDLPGGLVDPGETERDGVVREVAEETGLEVTPETTTLAYTATSFDAARHISVTKSLYLIQLDTTPPITLSWEHSAYNWVSLSDLRQHTDLRPFYNAAIAYCFEHQLLPGSEASV